MPAITEEAFDKIANPHYAAVGKVAASWAGFEHHLQQSIWVAAGIDFSIGACLTTQIGNSGRLIDALIAVLRLRGATEDNIKPLLSFAGDVGNKQRKRNRIVHDPWFFRIDQDEPRKTFRYELSASKTFVDELKHQPTDELQQFILSIKELSTTLDFLLTQIEMELPPL